MDLFDRAAAADPSGRPLAERMRPRRLEDFAGQEHVLGPGTALRRAIEADQVPSLILWGPPGTGKTTLARIMAQRTGAEFVPFSALAGGVKEIREIVAAARELTEDAPARTLLFVDEIHRFTRAQQDAFLPHVEDGTVTLIGATTENPSFEVNAALLSRCRVVTLRALTEDEVGALLDRAVAAPEGLGGTAWRSRPRGGRPSPATPTATPAGPSTRWRWPPRRCGWPGGTGSSGPTPRRRCRPGPSSTTRRARSTTTSSPPSSSRCAAPTRTPPSTTWSGCWRGARTRASCCAGW